MRILIVDQEYLIALEAERILQDSGLHETRIAMPWQMAKALQEEAIDLILIDSMLAAEGEHALLLRRSSASLVLMSFRSQDLSGVAGWPEVPVVPKPFDDEQLLRAVRSAMAARTA